MKNRKEITVELITLFVIFFIMCLGILLSCKSTYEYTNNVQSAVMAEQEYVYNKHQIDSTLIVDKLPLNFTENWFNSTYVDYETNEPIIQYFYYKTNDYNEVTDIYNYNNVVVDTIYNYSKSHISTLY